MNCFASLYTDRAISYRVDKGFDHMSVKLSIGVQKMVRSDLASSGVMFTLDPESGFRDAILITSSYGLGENIVGGRVDPDEFLVFKPTLYTHPTRSFAAKSAASRYAWFMPDMARARQRMSMSLRRSAKDTACQKRKLYRWRAGPALSNDIILNGAVTRNQWILSGRRMERTDSSTSCRRDQKQFTVQMPAEYCITHACSAMDRLCSLDVQ